MCLEVKSLILKAYAHHSACRGCLRHPSALQLTASRTVMLKSARESLQPWSRRVPSVRSVLLSRRSVHMRLCLAQHRDAHSVLLAHCIPSAAQLGCCDAASVHKSIIAQQHNSRATALPSKTARLVLEF